MVHTGRPERTESAEYYWRYIDLCEGDDLGGALQQATKRAHSTMAHIPDGRGDHRYGPGKWTIKEVIQHVLDAERIFSYRALRIARNDASPLPSFDENSYAPEARVERRALAQLTREYDVVRAATVALFDSFDEVMMGRTGIAAGYPTSVRALGWVITGHAIHHMRVIEERYLNP